MPCFDKVGGGEEGVDVKVGRRKKRMATSKQTEQGVNEQGRGGEGEGGGGKGGGDKKTSRQAPRTYLCMLGMRMPFRKALVSGMPEPAEVGTR